MASFTICDIHSQGDAVPATWRVSLRCKEISGSSVFSVYDMDSCYMHLVDAVREVQGKMDNLEITHLKDTPTKEHGVGEWIGIDCRLL